MERNGMLVVGLPNTGKRTLLALLCSAIGEHPGYSVSISRGKEVINKYLCTLRNGEWPQRDTSNTCVEIEIKPSSMLGGKIILVSRDVERIGTISLFFAIDYSRYIFPLDATANAGEIAQKYASIIEVLKELKKKPKIGKIIAVITKSDEEDIQDRTKWVKEHYRLFFNEAKSAGNSFSIHHVRIHTENGKPCTPPVLEGFNLLLLELLGNYPSHSQPEVEHLITHLTLPPQGKRDILNKLNEINKRMSAAWKTYTELKEVYLTPYSASISAPSIVDFIYTVNRIGRAMPENEPLRAEILRINRECTNLLYGFTKKAEFQHISKDIQPIIIKKPEDVLNSIFWELKIDEVITENSCVGTLSITNQSSETVEIYLDNISCFYGKIELLDSTNIELHPNTKGSVKFALVAQKPGTLLLRFAGEIHYKDQKIPTKKDFEIPVRDQTKVQAVVQIPVPQVPSPQQPPLESKTPGESIVDATQLLNNGSIEDWLRTIEDCILNNKKIDFKENPSTTKGYRNLLFALFKLDTGRYTEEEITGIFKDEFTRRFASLLYTLISNNKLEIPVSTTSDLKYFTSGLELITPKEEGKPKPREWNISARGVRLGKIKKEVEKREDGTAKKVIFIWERDTTVQS